MLLSLRIALKSLSAHKLRAVLAMLGVFLGALALTGVQNVSKAMVVKAEQEVEKFGVNLVVARAGQARFRRSGNLSVGPEARTFTKADARALAESLPGVVAYAPFIDEETRIRAGAKKVPCQIVATWPSFTGIRAFNARWGRFFTMEEERELERVVVLGVKVAERLFQTPERALGRMVFLQRAAFRVIGVMEPKGRDLSGTDQDEQVFMPLTTYMRRAANVDHIGGVYLRAAKGADLTRIKDAAASLLRRRHQIGPGETDDFTVLTARESIQLQRQALDLVFTLGVISSSVSFAVGGLGILSIMILLVRARRLEIGIRRAVGARRRDIVRQFLLESAIMSTTGGLLGVGAAAGLSLGLSLAGVFPLVVDQTVVSLSLAGSAILGVAAGAYPAWTASRLEILGVLRDQ